MRSWVVPVRVTMRGVAIVEAEDAEAATQVVAGGGFDVESGAEMVDWETDGVTRENV